MQEPTDRQLLDRELARYSAGGWQIVSQSESSFQVTYPHAVNSAATAIFVVGPLLLGVFVSLGSVTYGAVLFWIALIVAVLLALGHLCARPKFLYVTAKQLRVPPSIQHNAQGVTVCSVCHSPTRTDAASCRTCGVQFTKT